MTPHERLAAVMASDLAHKDKIAYATLFAITNGTGSASLPLPEVLALLKYANPGNLRDVRRNLQEAGFVQFELTRGILTWTLIGCEERAETTRSDDEKRAETTRSGDEEARRNDALSDEKRAETTRIDPKARRNDALSAPHMFVCLSDTPSSTKKTNKPRPLAPEQVRTVRLLTAPEIGISQSVAEAIALKNTFDDVVRQVFTYLHDLERRKVRGPGALINRFTRRFKPENLTAADLDSQLYCTYVEDRNARLVRDFGATTGPKQSPEELLRRYGA